MDGSGKRRRFGLALAAALAGAVPALAQDEGLPGLPELDPRRYMPPIYDSPGAEPRAEAQDLEATDPEAEDAAAKARRDAARLDEL